MTRVLLCSTYELGAQPLGCAKPAAVLSEAGHEIRMVDLAVTSLDHADIAWADAVAFSVPMHTAVRLGLSALATVRAVRTHIPVAFHGLYAHTVEGTGALGPGDLIATGDVDAALIKWTHDVSLDARSTALTVSNNIGNASDVRKVIPLRNGLPSLDAYAMLVGRGEPRIVGTIEATQGCNHTCRHCPVPVVYGGRSRAIDADAIAKDIAQLVALGAQHLHFADPDFLNRPAHALRIVDAFHRSYPELTFDATVKVTHILDHEQVLTELAAMGLLFVISAFESTSDVVLEQLDKGHAARDLDAAISILRNAGIEPRPSFLPFSPWTTPQDIFDLFDFIARRDLIENIDPVQYGIRLLLPPGSLLLDNPDPVFAAALQAAKDAEIEPDAVAIPWIATNQKMDELAIIFGAIAERAASTATPTNETYLALRRAAYAHFEKTDAGIPDAHPPFGPTPDRRPRLSESWFCCAEPTARQRAAVG